MFECPKCRKEMATSRYHPIVYFCGCGFKCSEGYLQGFWQGFERGIASKQCTPPDGGAEALSDEETVRAEKYIATFR